MPNINLPVNPSQSNAAVGKDFFLYISIIPEGETDPEWQLIGGQRGTSLSLTAEEIDVSDKTSGGWGSKKAGLRNWSMDLDGLVVMDDLGFQALDYAFINGREVHVLMLYPNSTGKKGWGSLTDSSLDTPHDDAASQSRTINGNGPLVEADPAELPTPPSAG